MKGVILAGGKGTRLYPLTKIICKQLLPIYDKPMIYYPLSVLMLAGIREILIITTKKDIDRFKEILSDGNQIGIQITYKVQPKPRGIADALIISEDFLNGDSVFLILGDNIIYGHGLPEMLIDAIANNPGGTVFGYYVKDPHRYGVVELGPNNEALGIEEKPKKPKSNYAVVGLYIYDNTACRIAKNLKPSKRNELEITDVNRVYLKRGELRIILLGRGYAWLDTGTFSSMVDATHYVKTVEERQGLKISCIEEIAYKMGYINKKQLYKLAEELQNTDYREYFEKVISGIY